MDMRTLGGKARRVWIVPTALALLATASSAGFYRPGRSYFDLRRQLGLADGNPTTCQEIRGTLSGTAQRDSETVFILSGDEGAFCVAATEPAPDIVSGNRLRMIVRTTDGPWMELVGFTYEAEAADIERAAIEHEKKRNTATTASGDSGPARPSGRHTRTDVRTSRGSSAADVANIVAQYGNAVRVLNPRLTQTEADLLARCLIGFGQRYNVDPRLVMAVIWAESSFRPTATSPKGAMGLGQLMPATAAGLGVWDAYDPVQNIEASVRLIRGHLNKLSGGKQWNDLTWGHLALALASYNAGSGAVRKYGGIPPYRETRRYVERVTSFYRRLCGTQ